MEYKIEITKSSQKVLTALSGKIYFSIRNQIDQLSINPHSPGSTTLKGHENIYRIRKGDFRIIYQIKNEQLLIIVLDIGSSGSIYQNY